MIWLFVIFVAVFVTVLTAEFLPSKDAILMLSLIITEVILFVCVFIGTFQTTTKTQLLPKSAYEIIRTRNSVIFRVDSNLQGEDSSYEIVSNADKVKVYKITTTWNYGDTQSDRIEVRL